MNSLFRNQAVEHARLHWGEPSKQFLVKSWVLTLFFISLLCVSIAFIGTARYARKETVLGVVVPALGVSRVAPLHAGLVKSVLVSSGKRVKKGDRLVAISYDVTLVDGAGLQDRMASVTQAQLHHAGMQGQVQDAQIAQERARLLARKHGIDQELTILRQQRDIQAERVSLLESTVVSSRELHAQKYMSTIQLRQREDQLLQGRQVLQQLNQTIVQNENSRSDIEQQARSLALQKLETKAATSLTNAQLEEKQLAGLSAQGNYILAPKDGHLTSLQVKEGDVVEVGQTLAMVVPDSPSALQLVNLWVPSRAIGFVKAGDHVRIMFDAFPYQTFGVGGGRVLEVSTAPLAPSDLPVPIDTREQMYKIVVALDRSYLTAYGRNWSLAPGMRLSADLVLEERTFLDWLLDPLTAVKKRAG